MLLEKDFLRALKEAGYPEVDLSYTWISSCCLCKWDEYAPLSNKQIP